ncbi:MAG TPA: sugar nucleotide-binding protein [Longimicrobium sp.]|nr:sugar nucleotide-binding protein [Longimicrobium sp.]
MSTPRVLILGAGGMLGHKLAHVLSEDAALEVHASTRRLPPEAFRAERATYHEGADLSSAAPLRRVLEAVGPDVVVNAAGAIKQKDLKAAVDETFYVNATLPHLIPLLAPRPVRMIHFSTDCVFKGDRGGYTEADAPDAEDLYGRSKACGEIDYGRHLTLRTSIIGYETAGFLGLVSWLLKQPEGATLPGYSRAIYSGLPTVTLSRTVRDLILHHPELAGLYHVASEPIDKLTLLEKLSEALGMGHRFTPSEAVIMDRSLNDDRFRAATGTTRPGWDALVAELADDYASLPYAEVYANLRAAPAAATA